MTLVVIIKNLIRLDPFRKFAGMDVSQDDRKKVRKYDLGEVAHI